MGRKDQSKYLNFNFINAYSDLEQFWNLESFRTLPKTHPNRLPKDEKQVVYILEKTGEFI